MAERLVLCGGSKARTTQDETLHLNLTGPEKNIKLRVRDITTRMVANVPDLVTDLLELAAYVYSADCATSRGGPMMRAMGADWRRRFRFVIPVRNPELWSSDPVIEALSDALEFLTEDEYQFEFEEHRGTPEAQEYLELGNLAPGFDPDAVVLFSGGLDSLAGVVELVLGHNKKVALVSHHSSNKVAARQKRLVATLRKVAPGMLQHFPVLLQKQQSLTKEYTFRSRSFVFASLAAAISQMLGKQRILMCENGIVSLNLPIARQLVGARASRTTHPKALACFGLLFEALFEKDPPRVENPLFWRTKAEVVQLIGNHGCSHLIDPTVSCSHVHEISTKQPHCGEGSQCVDRRFGVLGAGLEEHDPEAKYRQRLLVDDWSAGEPRTLAESYIRFAIDTRNASTETLYARFAGELSRAVQFMPGDRDSSARQLIAMQQRHATSVFSILEQEVRRHASGLLDGSLPAHCLLRMAVSSHSEQRHAADRDPSPTGELSATSDGRRLKDGVVAPEIQIAVNDAARIVLVRGGPEFKGADYNFLSPLLHVFEEDLRNQKAPENYRYTSTRALAAKLKIGEPTVRQRVLRIRRRLFEWFADDYPLPQDALIENTSWNGYRINPAVRLLSLSEIAGADQASPSCGRNVTT